MGIKKIIKGKKSSNKKTKKALTIAGAATAGLATGVAATYGGMYMLAMGYCKSK